ncbi:unnamed protein product, partial [Polarella glacialis]
MAPRRSQRNAAAEEAVVQANSHRNVDHNPKEALANTAQRACGRCLVKGDVVYTTVDTGAGYVAMCNFSPQLCNTMGIHQGMGGVVAESKNAAEHNAASAMLSVLYLLGVECGPKKSKVSTEAPIQSPRGLQGPSSDANTAMPKLQSQQNVTAVVDHSPKEALAKSAQKACGRCLVKGDVVYTTVDTGAGYVAMCNFSLDLCNTMGIQQGMWGAVAESKKAAVHNCASAMLSVLGVECGPKKSKVSTEAPIQSPRGLQGPSSGAKTAMPKLQSQQIVAAVVDNTPKEALANTAQRACGRCLVKGDVVYTTVDTGAGYVAMCSFSLDLCNTMGIQQGMWGGVAESKNAAEHNCASAMLSVLGVECGPKKSKVSTEAPIQSPRGLQGPSSSAKKTIAPMAVWINSAEKGLKDRAPIGLNICIPEEEEEELFSTPAFSELPPWRRAAAENTSQIPKVEVHVRNTFIHIGAPGLEADGFYRERAVVSCPGSNVGRLRQLFQDASLGHVLEVPPTPEYWRNATPVASKVLLRLDDALADTVPSTPEAYAVSGLSAPAHYLDSPPDLQGFMGESIGMQHAQDACPYYQHH